MGEPELVQRSRELRSVDIVGILERICRGTEDTGGSGEDERCDAHHGDHTDCSGAQQPERQECRDHVPEAVNIMTLVRHGVVPNAEPDTQKAAMSPPLGHHPEPHIAARPGAAGHVTRDLAGRDIDHRREQQEGEDGDSVMKRVAVPDTSEHLAEGHRHGLQTSGDPVERWREAGVAALDEATDRCDQDHGHGREGCA